VVEELDHFQISSLTPEIYSGEESGLRVAALDSGQNPFKDFKGKLSLAASNGLVFPSDISGFKDGVWEGKIAVTGSGPLTLTVSDGRKTAALDIQVKERAEKAQFPLTIPCRTCQTAVTVQAPDIYRCEECDETFFVDAWGHTFTLKPGSTAKRRKSKYKGMELKINTDVNYLSAIRDMISGLCAKEGMDPVTTNSVALAIEEILLNLMEHGNDFDPWQILKVRMDFQKRQVKIQIRDYGDPYDVTQHKDLSIKSSVVKGLKRGVGTFLVNQLMDQVKYESTKSYNQLTMIKHYGTPETK
jgi:anti-sigma regulatory factor (Ser/Thr protein kinase)